MTRRAEAVKAIEAAEAQQVAVSAAWKAFQAGWNPEWQQHPEADRFRTPQAALPKKPSMTPGEAARQVEEARRQLAGLDAAPAIEAARRAAAKVEAAKAKVAPIVAEAEKKLAAVREEFVAALGEFSDLWKLVPEAARDLLPMPFCVAAPYADLSIVQTISARP
jgi:hypothetical protein